MNAIVYTLFSPLLLYASVSTGVIVCVMGVPQFAGTPADYGVTAAKVIPLERPVQRCDEPKPGAILGKAVATVSSRRT